MGAGWRQVGNVKAYFRSTWEANFARWLQYQKEKGWISDWSHEPKTFWFEGIRRGCVSYKPDFRVNKHADEVTYWVEIKGYMDARSKTKIKRFKKYFPDEDLVVVDKKFFRENNAKLRALIPTWEIGDASEARKIQERRFRKYKNRDARR